MHSSVPRRLVVRATASASGRRLLSSGGPPSAHATWSTICAEADAEARRMGEEASRRERGPVEPSFGIRSFLRADVLAHDSLATALACKLGDKLNANSASDHVNFNAVVQSAFEADPSICAAIASVRARPGRVATPEVSQAAAAPCRPPGCCSHGGAPRAAGH